MKYCFLISYSIDTVYSDGIPEHAPDLIRFYRWDDKDPESSPQIWFSWSGWRNLVLDKGYMISEELNETIQYYCGQFNNELVSEDFSSMEEMYKRIENLNLYKNPRIMEHLVKLW